MLIKTQTVLARAAPMADYRFSHCQTRQSHGTSEHIGDAWVASISVLS